VNDREVVNQSQSKLATFTLKNSPQFKPDTQSSEILVKM
jgi:hypothetical protein